MVRGLFDCTHDGGLHKVDHDRIPSPRGLAANGDSCRMNAQYPQHPRQALDSRQVDVARARTPPEALRAFPD
jgi:hypothetical protein